MEWLGDIWGWLVAIGAIGTGGGIWLFASKIGINIACKLIDKYLPDEKLREWGRPLAVGATEFMVAKLGKNWNKLEDKLQYKLGVFLKEANTGLDSDDG
jgi:hypothetical protein